MPIAILGAKRVQKVKIAIVGAGLVGKRHIDAIDRLNNVCVSSIVDLDETAQDIAQEKGVPYFKNLSHLFAAQMPDGIVLATPTPLHIKQGLECISHGCPILVEKPLSISSKEALDFVHQAERNNVPVLIGHHRRHNPLISRARKLISDGEIGDIRSVHMNCWFYKPDHYFDNAPWRKKMGAGPISVNLVHDIDLVRYLCGEVESVRAQAAPSARGFENEDVAAAILKFRNGAIGTITVSDSIVSPWSWEMTSGEYPVYPSTLESCYLIGGSHGSLSVPDLRIWSHQDGVRDWWTPISATSLTHEASDPLVNQMAHFADVVIGHAEPLVSAREGLQTLQVVEAIQNACASDDAVSIGEIEVPEAMGNVA